MKTHIKAVLILSLFSGVAHCQLPDGQGGGRRAVAPAIVINTSSGSTTITHSDASAPIYYTTDGSTPTRNSTLYTGAFSLGGGTHTVKAVAYSSPSTVASSTATVTAITLVTFGDSITDDPAGNAGVAGSNTYPQQVAALMGDRQGVTINLTQVGLSGSSWNYTVGGGVPTLSNYLPGAVGAAASSSAKLVLFAGTNGICLGSHSAATEFANFETTLGTLLGEGYLPANIVVATMLPRESCSEVTRASYNSLLISGAVTYGYSVARLDLNTDIGIAGQQSTSTDFFFDQIHPTVISHNQIARTIYDQLYPSYTWSFADAYGVTLAMRYDAQVGGSITQSGGNVSAWADQSTNARDLTQATAAKPTYAATGINGHPAIAFDGSGQYLHGTLSGFIGDNASFWFVGSTAIPGSAQLFWQTSTNDSSWDSGNYLDINGNIELQFSGKSADNWASAPNTSAHVYTGYQLNANPRLFFDGTYPGIRNFIISAAGTTAVNGLQLGKPFQFGFWALQGNIGELGFYAGRLTAYDRMKLEAYLKAKWGTP